MVPPRSHPQGVSSKDKYLALDEPYLKTPLDQKLDLCLKSYSNFYIIGLFGAPKSHLYIQKQSFRIFFIGSIIAIFKFFIALCPECRFMVQMLIIFIINNFVIEKSSSWVGFPNMVILKTYSFKRKFIKIQNKLLSNSVINVCLQYPIFQLVF